MKKYEQLLIDWEKTGRDAVALERHCRLAGLEDGDIALLLVMLANGRRDQNGGTFGYFSVRRLAALSLKLSAEYRRLGDITTDDGRRWLKLAAQAKLSAGTVSKAIARLGVARSKRTPAALPLVAYDDAVDDDGRKSKRLAVSWRRIWALEVCGGSKRFEALRLPQEQETHSQQPIPRTNYDGSGGREARRLADGGDVLDRIQAAHAAAVERLAGKIMQALGPIETRHRTPADKRLTWETARRIASGLCDNSDTGRVDELERLLGSAGRVARFNESPAAYVVKCAQRREWIERAELSLAIIR